MKLLPALFAIGLFALPAKAQLADCMTEGYLSSFQVAGVKDLTCVEVFRFSFPTPAGDRILRAISDLNADWAFQPGTVAAVEAAAREATSHLADLGNYRIGDVTILLLADQLTPEARREPDARSVLAQAWDPLDRVASECRMTQFLWGAGGVIDSFPTTLAHELFHCVQYATLSPEQMATFGGMGDWWIEGSAEAFAAHAIVDSIGTAGWGADFNAAVTARTPLYEMTYEAVIFFYWYLQERDMTALLPFLAGMSPTPGAAGQRDAMRDMLGDADWLHFAEAFVDDEIRHPHGQALGLQGQFPIEHLVLTRTGTERMAFPPFAVIPGMASYDCGRWDNRATEANLSSRMASASDWSPGWRGEVDTRDGGEADLRFAAIHTGDEDLDFRLRMRRLAACSPCRGSTEIDQCLVGTWQGDMSPIIELMRRAGAPVTRNAMGEMYLQVNEDGTFVTSSVPIDFQVTETDEDGDTTVDVTGTAGMSAGRWSILGPGRLAGCAELTEGTVAEGAVQSPEISGSVALFGPPGGAEEGVVSYSCSAAAMATRVTMGRFGEVEFAFQRLSPPPEDDEGSGPAP